MLDGAARKIALPFVLFSAVGWVVFAVGLGLTNHRETNENGKAAVGWEFFPHWGFGVSAILLFAVTITHLFCGNPVTIFLIMFFQAFYYACGGAVAYEIGIRINDSWARDDEKTLHSDFYDLIVQFTGAGISMIFYWVSLMFWPCFKRKGEDD